MSVYLLTEQAELDLQNIWDYIATESMETADAVAAEIQQAFEKLAQMPGLGHRRIDVRSRRVRFWSVRRFVIAYFPDTQPLQIVRIVGGERDFRRLFK